MEPRFKWQDAVGLVGVFLAIGGMADMPLVLRTTCFALCALFMPFSFFSHKNWPGVVRSGLSVVVVGLMAFMIYHIASANVPATVSISWYDPPPITVGTPLGGQQLNAKAWSAGREIEGDFVYNPTFGATLPAGIQTLSAAFTPKDSASRPVTKTVTIRVKQPEILDISPAEPHPTDGSNRQKPRPARDDSWAFVRHTLSSDEQKKFVATLSSQSGLKGPIRISCPSADESVCIYAAQFIDLFKSAGLVVEGGVVNRVSLGVPYEGIRLFTHSDNQFDPAQPPGTGHWVTITPSLMAVRKGFVSVGIGTDTGGEDDISGETVNVYFGPQQTKETAVNSLMQTEQQLKSYDVAMSKFHKPQ